MEGESASHPPHATGCLALLSGHNCPPSLVFWNAINAKWPFFAVWKSTSRGPQLSIDGRIAEKLVPFLNALHFVKPNLASNLYCGLLLSNQG